MKRLGSTAPLDGGQEVALPAGVEELLVEVVADGFTLYCCGPKDAPHALVGCYEWQYYTDLLTVRDFARVITARVPTQDRGIDIFAPEIVVWAYEGPPQHAVRALLELVHPAHPDAPTAGYPAPAGLRISRAQQRPMSIQLPLPSRARVRADRLATAITTSRGAAGGPPDARSRRPAGHSPAIGRQPGSGGQNLYPADLVRARQDADRASLGRQVKS